MAQALAYMFIAGPTLALITLVLPHHPDTRELGVAVVCGVACVIGVIVYRAGGLRPRTVQIVVAFGTVLITIVIHYAGAKPSAYAMFYLWVSLYSFYFFSRRVAVLEGLLVAACYAALLAFFDRPAGGWFEPWVLTIGTLAVACSLVYVLKQRVSELIARLAENARTDPLTGLLNRRGFQELLEGEVERAQRSGAPLSLVLVDLDRFKDVNDAFGHRAGDEALARAAAAIRGSKRRIDAAARIGGDEFALILPDTDADGAWAAAERLRRAVRDSFATEPVPVTASVGVVCPPGHGRTADALLDACDAALYAAKALGRDRSVLQALDPDLRSAPGARPRREQDPELATVLALAEALDVRDTGTAGHSRNVARYAEVVARELGLSPAAVERVHLAGLLHDVGKIGVPDSILRKPGALTEEEWTDVRKHPEAGARLLGSAVFDDVRAWVLAHHERPDGRGYPYGLEDEEIPLEASIVAAADAYEAMTADRPYRPGLPREQALAELRTGAGSQFDERVVSALLRVLEADSAGAAEETAPAQVP